MLEQKVVVITGVAGGLGRALAERFVQQGCRVAGVGRNQQVLDELQAQLPGERYASFTADVSKFDQVQHVVREIAEKYGRIDILFNNAAVYPKINFLEESAEKWFDTIAINMGGIANFCKAVLPLMIEHKYGRIFNLGSFADVAPIEKSCAYSCSKGGVHALTKAIAKDIESLNLDIEIHEWMPGHLKTQMSDFTGIEPAVSAVWGVDIASGKIKASKKNSIFENDREWVPPKSLKQRIKQKLLFWK